MSGQSTTLSDRLKSVEDELNMITSYMSLQNNLSRCSLTNKSSSVSSMGNSVCNRNKNNSNNNKAVIINNNKKCRNRSRSSSNVSERASCANICTNPCRLACSDTKLSSGSSSNSSASIPRKANMRLPQKHLTHPDGDSVDNKDMKRENSQRQPHESGYVQNVMHNINDAIIKGNQAVITKMNNCSEGFKYIKTPSELPTTYSGTSDVSASFTELTYQTKFVSTMKELEVEKEKRAAAEHTLEEVKCDLNISKQELKRIKDLSERCFKMNEQMEKEIKKQDESVTTNELEMELRLHKQKYEALLKDYHKEQEQGRERDNELRNLNEICEQGQLKTQELSNARMIALDMARDMQKKHQNFVADHDKLVQQLKSRNSELEKLLDDSETTIKRLFVEKSNLLDRVQTLQETSNKYNILQVELDNYKIKLDDAERKIKELNRNPESIPQVKNILNSQEQSYKAALIEKATSEMTLQAKYTTLEVELQIVQDEYTKRFTEMELENKKVQADFQKRLEEKDNEITKVRSSITEFDAIVEKYKVQLNELSAVNKHQEVLINCQNEAISSKEEQVRLVSQESELNVERVEHDMKALRLEQEKTINTLKKLLEEERDKYRVKEQVANDQAETIIKLKHNLSTKAKEISNTNKELKNIEHLLQQEINEKEISLSDIQHLKMHRSRLNNTIKELENKLDEANKTKDDNSSAHEKHMQKLEELEKKVAEKQAEWELNVTKLTKERDQAKQTAQYAIENLKNAMDKNQKELQDKMILESKLENKLKMKHAERKEKNKHFHQQQQYRSATNISNVSSLPISITCSLNSPTVYHEDLENYKDVQQETSDYVGHFNENKLHSPVSLGVLYY